MSVYAGIFWFLAAVALFTPEWVALSLFVCTAAFGALNLLPDSVGGANLLPQSAAAIVLVIRIAMKVDARRTMLAGVLNWRGFALLAGFAVYACLTAVILPFIFKDRIQLFPLDVDAIVNLEPSSSNFNQSAYLLANAATALALFAYLNRKPAMEAREVLLKALLASGGVFFISGLIDYTGVAPDFVASFKTAHYRLFLETEVVHVRRITGFFSEAAAYGGPCVHLGALLFFTRTAFGSSMLRNWVAPLVSCAMIALGALSTSSTAYIGIFMFGCLVVGRMGYRMYQGQPVSDLRVELAIAGFLILVLGVVGFIDPDLLATPLNVLDNMVMRKATSESYIHRDLWNHFATRAFKQSFGLGVGAGSVRASDWAISVLSNTGVIGFALMGGFIGLLFWTPPSASGGRGPAMAVGAKFALGVFLTTQIASGTTVDPGLMLAIIAAMVMAGSKWADELTPKKRRSKSKRSRDSKESKGKSRSRRRRTGTTGSAPVPLPIRGKTTRVGHSGLAGTEPIAARTPWTRQIAALQHGSCGRLWA